MILFKKNRVVIIMFFILFLAGVLGVISDYNLYALSFNGKVQNIRTNIKEVMYITVNNKEYDIEHHWPTLQKNIAIGDSVCKVSKDSVIILVKAITKKKILCNYRDKRN